jgi:hypothetical protein
MNYHVHEWAVQRETVHLPDAKALKAKSGLTGGTCGDASLIIDTKGRDAGMAHQTGRHSKPLSERCCLEFVRPSRADGGCHPEGRRADSIAPSAALSSAVKAAAPTATALPLAMQLPALDFHRRAA